VAKDLIDYEAMVQTALRDVVKKAIGHHFYVTFATDHPGVVMPDYLRDQYGDEITIVLQYEFWDLLADTKGFYVTLCFDDAHEKLYIPYSGLLSFVDHSVKFGLQFNPVNDEPIETGKTVKADKPSEKSEKGTSKKADSAKGTSNIVTLDSFRKK
jgi:hypothetical protein